MTLQRILVLAPHADDAELSAGGTVARFLEGGAEVHYAVFSLAEKSVPEGLPRDVLKGEQLEAMNALGVPGKNLVLFGYPVREFPARRQEVLEDLVKLARDLDPDLVLQPAASDVHQDHHVVAMEGIRAFKRRTVLGYETTWNNVAPFEARAFVPITEAHLQRKIQACLAYKSQSHRDYVDAETIRSVARTRGLQAGVPLAEAFEVVRWVMLP